MKAFERIRRELAEMDRVGEAQEALATDYGEMLTALGSALSARKRGLSKVRRFFRDKMEPSQSLPEL